MICTVACMLSFSAGSIVTWLAMIAGGAIKKGDEVPPQDLDDEQDRTVRRK